MQVPCFILFAPANNNHRYLQWPVKFQQTVTIPTEKLYNATKFKAISVISHIRTILLIDQNIDAKSKSMQHSCARLDWTEKSSSSNKSNYHPGSSIRKSLNHEIQQIQ